MLHCLYSFAIALMIEIVTCISIVISCFVVQHAKKWLPSCSLSYSLLCLRVHYLLSSVSLFATWWHVYIIPSMQSISILTTSMFYLAHSERWYFDESSMDEWEAGGRYSEAAERSTTFPTVELHEMKVRTSFRFISLTVCMIAVWDCLCHIWVYKWCCPVPLSIWKTSSVFFAIHLVY